MRPLASADEVTPEWLSGVLTRGGRLPRGRVVEITSWRDYRLYAIRCLLVPLWPFITAIEPRTVSRNMNICCWKAAGANSGLLCIRPIAAGATTGRAVHKMRASRPVSGGGMGLIHQSPRRAKRPGKSVAKRFHAPTACLADFTIAPTSKAAGSRRPISFASASAR